MSQDAQTIIAGIDGELQYHKEYLSMIEGCFDRAVTSRKLERYETGPTNAFELSYLELLEKHYPDLTRKSLFADIYSAVETNLINACRDAEERKNLSLSLTDLSGLSSIGKAKKYLEKVAGIKFPDTHEWKELNNYR